MDKYRGPIAGAIKVFLYLISLIYGLFVRIVIFIRGLSPRRPACKVVSVGNITLGGTGKTPLVLYIARYLKDKGRKVAIVSRGYNRGRGTMGDEPYMLKINLEDIPVIVDPDRIRAVNYAIRGHGVDTVILDDGMQQWGIRKDLEIVAIDGSRLFGNRRLIPRGILREPLSSLKRADIFLLTKSDLGPGAGEARGVLERINSKALQVESVHSPSGFYRLDKPAEPLSAEGLSGRSAALFSAIADPGSFELLAARLGVKVSASFRFRDHHNYTQKDIDGIMHKSRQMNIEVLLTTEKDAARLRQLPDFDYGIPVWFLRVQLKITKNEERFRDRLLGLYTH
jgi:tetraacyldisaccharide 4'-kinase